MKLSEFMTKYSISQSEMKMHTCKSKTYKDSEDKIILFYIPAETKFSQGAAHRTFVLCHSAPEAYLTKEVEPGELEVISQADYGYSIVPPLEGEEIEW